MQTIKNVKIPYPTEGVIRTAQINDTIAPQDSVNLAVNMNFDRIGTAQTRKGIQQYADDVASSVKNLGTLNNFTMPAGFDRIVQVGQAGEFYDAAASYISSVKIDSTHVLTAWKDENGNGRIQVFLFDAELQSCTPIGTALLFDTGGAVFYNNLLQIDSTHYMNTWVTTGGHVQSCIFVVVGDSIGTAAAAFTVDTASSSYIASTLVGSSHAILFYDNGSGGQAVILAINTSTWAITKPASALTFDAIFAPYNSCASLGDGTHFINFWGRGLCQVFEVNTSTWAITALGSAYAFDSAGATNNSCISLGDGTHFINFWEGFKGSGIHGIAQVFEVNTSTWAITEPGTYTYFSTFTSGSSLSISAVGMGDGSHFVASWIEGGTYGNTQIFFADSADSYNVTAINYPVSYGEISSIPSINMVELDSSHVAIMWEGTFPDGLGSLFRLDGTPVSADLLFAHVGTTIESWDGSSWTTRRSGLSASSGKARFAQYLNRLWMVNGNVSIGDPVMTSNGGTFDTTLVPNGFPAADLISAGFEGRVWVADTLYGVIYYTDIVQFVAPDFYQLTFNQDINTISQFAPQNGETITALHEVPRALLVFTENHIYRIYGATSIDAYAAYNVGTYSNESIIETKSGLFFHHSSGFYEFDYGGQPVEISRRIIDIVQAIPRSAYENVTGVWDGFDNVEWSVGDVTIDGTLYPNCVLRYTISTQVWTVYSYIGNTITAMIRFDDGTTVSYLMGTDAGKVASLDTGYDDLGSPFFFELIDRWRNYTEIYAEEKSMSGIAVYHENAQGASIAYQLQGAGQNEWTPLDTIDMNPVSLFPNIDTDDFNASRFRITGTSKGSPIVIQGIEVLSVTNKGFNQN